METHLFNLIAYSVLVSAMFSLFMREGRRERLRFTALLAAAMIGISVAASWMMGLVR